MTRSGASTADCFAILTEADEVHHFPLQKEPKNIDSKKKEAFFPCECHLLLFRVLHCTGAVTVRSVFPLYFVNGSVQLGNSESVLIQHPYLSDSSPLPEAAGWIGSAAGAHAFRPASLIAVEKNDLY